MNRMSKVGRRMWVGMAIILVLIGAAPAAGLAQRNAVRSTAADLMRTLREGRASDVRSPEAPAAPAAPDAPSASQQTRLNPYDPAPAMTFPTTTGDLRIGGGAASDVSYILLGYSGASPLAEALWTSSFKTLFEKSPKDVHYVFISYAARPAEVQQDIDMTRARVDAAIGGLADAADRQHWASHVHYVTQNPLAQAGAAADLLLDWGSIVARVKAEWRTAAGEMRSVDTVGTTDTGWAKSLAVTGPIEGRLARYGNLACGADTPVEELGGRVVLIERGVCTFVEKVVNAAKHGASAVILYTDALRAKARMPGSCSPCPEIPVTMIDRAPGLEMMAALEASIPVTATLGGTRIGVEAMAVDHAGRVREFGSIPFPFNNLLTDGGEQPVDNLLMVAYEAQYMHYEHLRDRQLAAQDAAGTVVRVPLYQAVWHDDPGWTGRRAIAEVDLPSGATMSEFDTLEVDFGMSCPDNRRANCPAWDYLVYLYLCDKSNPDQCNVEFGRWITPYWSGGRWVTDLSPMLALINEGGKQRFGFWTVQRYKLDMTFRLSNRGKALVPKRAVPLLSGGDFHRDYNKRYHPLAFEMPDWAEKVEVVALVTGHGQRDDEGCGEFCNHTHHIRVNGGAEHVKAHPTAGTLMGCADRVLDGVVPNQAGTWIFGRAGWCPGLDVPPWIIDITPEVRRGQTNILTYKALFNGQDYVSRANGDPNTPPPDGYDARIEVTSWLVYYAKPDVQAGPVAPPVPQIPPTETPSPVPTPIPSPTPTSLPPTAPPPPTPTPAAPPDGEICANVAGRVPGAVLSAKLSDPTRINGYHQLCNPNQPLSPFNVYRTRLTLQHPSRPYHPLFNDLVFRCGCR